MPPSSTAWLYRRWTVALLSLAALIGLGLHQFGWPVSQADAVVFTLQRGPAMDLVMAWATAVGGEEALAFLTAALMTALIYRGSRRAAIFLGIGLTAGNLAGASLKWVFDRPRPPIDYQPSLSLPGWFDEIWIGLPVLVLLIAFPTKWRIYGLLVTGLTALLLTIDLAGEAAFSDPGIGASYPSGHAVRTMAWAVSLILVSWPTAWRREVILASAAFVILVGTSRVYLGVHYPTDILGGWAAAVAAIAGLSLVREIDPLRPARKAWNAR